MVKWVLLLSPAVSSVLVVVLPDSRVTVAVCFSGTRISIVALVCSATFPRFFGAIYVPESSMIVFLSAAAPLNAVSKSLNLLESTTVVVSASCWVSPSWTPPSACAVMHTACIAANAEMIPAAAIQRMARCERAVWCTLMERLFCLFCFVSGHCSAQCPVRLQCRGSEDVDTSSCLS